MDTIRKKAKILVMFCLFVCAFGTSNAQDYYGGGWRKKPAENQPQDKEDKGNPPPTGYMSINFGFANPEGGYAASTAGTYGGFGLPGTNINFSMAFPINHSNFGLAFMFGSYTNTYDNNNFINYISNSSNSGNYEYGSVSGGIDNIYALNSIMGGLYVTYPLGRFSIDGRFMAGVLLSSLPEQAYGKEDTAGNVTTYDMQVSNSVSLAFDAGIGIRCLIVKWGRRQICAMVNLDYLYSNVPYSTVQVEDYYPSNPNILPTEIDNNINGTLNVSLFNITFGLGYQF
jgi:hypothetical protein